MDASFSDAALIVVGHGSTLNAESSAPTYQHADTLRKRGIFGQVLECFWKLEPGVSGVLRGVRTRRVFVVPLFISDGYFTEQVIPRELGLCRNGDAAFPRVQERDGRRIHYCGPVGTHEAMTEVLLSRAREVVALNPIPKTPALAEITLFIAGHGTGNNENSRKAIERQVELIQARGLYAAVHPIFMEEEPRIQDCYTIASTRYLVIVPFFISDGLHSYEDIPVMLGEASEDVSNRLQQGQPTWVNPTERKDKVVWYSASIGNEPLIADVILERVRQAASMGAGA